MDLLASWPGLEALAGPRRPSPGLAFRHYSALDFSKSSSPDLELRLGKGIHCGLQSLFLGSQCLNGSPPTPPTPPACSCPCCEKKFRVHSSQSSIWEGNRINRESRVARVARHVSRASGTRSISDHLPPCEPLLNHAAVDVKLPCSKPLVTDVRDMPNIPDMPCQVC